MRSDYQGENQEYEHWDFPGFIEKYAAYHHGGLRGESEREKRGTPIRRAQKRWGG